MNKAQWQRLGDFAALAAAILVAGAMVLGTFFWFGVDFRAFYAAGRLLLNGQDPYDYELTVPILLEVSGEVGNAPFYYPPWFALLMVPFAILPYDAARIAWLCWSLALWGMSVWLARSALRWDVRGWRLWLMVISMLYLLLWVCIRSEQTGPLACFSLALALWAIEREQPVLSGVALAMLLTKPQIVALAWLLLFARAVGRRWWVCLTSLFVTLALLLAVSWWAIPGWHVHFMEKGYGLGLKSMLEGPGNVIGKRLTSTLPDLLWFAGVPDPVANLLWAVLALFGVGGLFLLWLGKANPTYTLATSLPIWFLITPYSQQYDYVLMTFSAMWAYREIGLVRRWRKWIAGGIVLILHSLLLWEGISVQGLWLPVGMCLLLACLGWGRASMAREPR